jgi:predicted enzyme related to lactoylglutathione lyase
MSTIHGTVCWSELMTRDVAAARRWYEQVCGWHWEVSAMPDGDYHVAMAHGRPVAGLYDMTGQEAFEKMPSHWFTYLAVDDVDAALAQATSAGGTVIRPPFEVPDVGRIALVTDAGGAALGLMVPVSEWDPPETESGSLENVPV